ncbi:hypothetical protein EXIGLDRAFT_769995 [Exidia glandulosa HHB12029]|uniref:TMEM14-domain-containing protein n=1 Tax=Exidia glandulosa HHB12029 TaxID=1314781 RepID=A0A165H2B8_EXIGL|nr:hypothetical protein EXIGLDRAFT_769995 [Exidia glandulosa HHB12029]
MSAIPAATMGVLCIVGGITGYARTHSVPSLVAGCSVGLLYAYSANGLTKGAPNALEAALGASAILFLSSLPRASKGPVPATLTVTAAIAGAYYGRTWLALRNARRV